MGVSRGSDGEREDSRGNSLYKKADQKILDKVKKEKQFRQEFQKELKTIKGREPG